MTFSLRSGASDSALQINGTDALPFNAGGTTNKILSITGTVAANALTITLNPCILDFRNSTLSNGVPNTRLVNSAISIVIPSGASLGTIANSQSDIIVLAIDVAGVVELAVINIAGGMSLDEKGLISTTAISAAATASGVYYSTTARTSAPYRVVGFIESTQVTAGTWAAAPTTVQGSGGNALTGFDSIGYGQTWQNVALTPGRVIGTTYYNTTDKPILVNLYASTVTDTVITLTVNGVPVSVGRTNVANGGASGTVLVPSGASYLAGVGGATVNSYSWIELR